MKPRLPDTECSDVDMHCPGVHGWYTFYCKMDISTRTKTCLFVFRITHETWRKDGTWAKKTNHLSISMWNMMRLDWIMGNCWARGTRANFTCSYWIIYITLQIYDNFVKNIYSSLTQSYTEIFVSLFLKAATTTSALTILLVLLLIHIFFIYNLNCK